tara:strand:+ start:323 stop:844 length:522 start_codon:yes stop_codon:yes gene_type:complete
MNLEALEQLAELKNQGLLSETEFQQLKERLLSQDKEVFEETSQNLSNSLRGTSAGYSNTNNDDLESTDDADYLHTTMTENSNSSTLAVANFFVTLARILLILSLLVGIILLSNPAALEPGISIAVAIAVLVGGTLQSLFLLLISSYIKSRTLNHVQINSMLFRHLSEIVKNTK